MKVARLSLLLLTLVVSMMAAPEAFGARGGGKVVKTDLSKAQTASCLDATCIFYCYNSPFPYCTYNGPDTCRGTCEFVCGGPCSGGY